MSLFIHILTNRGNRLNRVLNLHTTGAGLCGVVDLYWGVSVSVLGERAVILSITDNPGHTIV